MYEQLAQGVNKANQPSEGAEVLAAAKAIVKKYPETPSGKEVSTLLTACEPLAGAAPAGK
jgi:hypothetical protein